MNIFFTILGTLLIGYGIYTMVLRFKAPHKLGKIDAMKETWGTIPGLVLHVLAYSVAPIFVGIIFFLRGIAGLGIKV